MGTTVHQKRMARAAKSANRGKTMSRGLYLKVRQAKTADEAVRIFKENKGSEKEEA